MCRFLFFFAVVKPITVLLLGFSVRRQELLPGRGPAILVANHNSHLDTVLLLSLFPYSLAKKVRPVAAADYFLRKRWLAWFAQNVARIIPVDRKRHCRKDGLMRHLAAAFEAGEIVLVFPEGTRGEPECLGHLQPGVAHIAKLHPDVPIIPVFLHGAGKTLPRGEAVLVPFFCDVFVGERLQWRGDRTEFMESLGQRFQDLAEEGDFAKWA